MRRIAPKLLSAVENTRHRAPRVAAVCSALLMVVLTAGLSTQSSAQVITVGFYPTAPSGLTGVQALTANYRTVGGLKSDGSFTLWGDFHAGLTGSGYKAVSMGQQHTLGLRPDGTVVATGQNNYHVLDIPTGLSNVVAITSGDFHNAVLKSDGTVTTWGGFPWINFTPPTGLSNVTAIASGSYHTLALKSDGTVVGWGDGTAGDTTPPSTLTGVVAVAAGQEFSLALKSDGTVVAWGSNEYGNIDVPAGLSNVIAISAGMWNSYALKSDHTVVAWGRTSLGATAVSGLNHIVAMAGNGIAGHFLRATTVADEYTVLAGQPLTVGAASGVLTNDFGVAGFTPQIVSQANHGTVTLNADGSFSYKPSAYFAGDDTFIYRNVGPDFNTENATVTIHNSGLAISLDTSTVVGGQYMRGSLSLGSVVAPIGGLTFDITYGSGLTGPSTVTIPEGQSSVRFRALADTVDTTLSTSVSAALGLTSTTNTVTVSPASLASVVVSPGSVRGGGRVSGSVRLNGQAGPSGTTIALSSGDPSISVPANVTVPAGRSSAAFVVTTSPVTSDTDVQVTAGGTASANLRVLASGLAGLTLSRSSAPAGTHVVGTVRLSSPAPVGGVTVSLASSDPAVSVPTSVIVPAGASSRSFDLASSGVDSDVAVTVTATLGSTVQTVPFTVTASQLTGIFPNPAAWQGGKNSSLAVRLDGAAGPAGAVVSLSSSDPLITVPTTVTLGSGTTSKVFTVTSRKVTTPTQVTLTATYNGVTKTVVVTLNP